MRSGERPNQGTRLRAREIYLHEADEYVGPFCRREDAEQFIALSDIALGDDGDAVRIGRAYKHQAVTRYNGRHGSGGFVRVRN